MKKQLLFEVMLGIAITSQAQTTSTHHVHLPVVPAYIANHTQVYNYMPVAGEEQIPFYDVKPVNKTVTPHLLLSIPWTETVIGGTIYDLQTNRSIQNRIIVNADGTISAVWTYSNKPSALDDYSDRGTGYNYYDGGWGSVPTARVENIRTGWPNIGVSNYGEVIVSHEPSDIHVATRTGKGNGAWVNQSLGAPDVWPRMGLGGPDGKSIHIISQTSGVNNGGTGAANPPYHQQDGALAYTRSKDFGVTWDKKRVIIPGLDSSLHLGFAGDEYAMDVQGSTIVIVAGGFTYDVVMVKSTDNGDTWTRTVIDTFPIPLWDNRKTTSDINNDNIPDTLITTDGAVTVRLDNNGKAHVAYGRMRVLGRDTTQSGLSYFPGTDGLFYWNENMAGSNPEIVTGVLDLNNNGLIDLPGDTSTNHYRFGSYLVGFTSHPSIGFDTDNNVYLCYSSLKEGTNQGNDRCFRHTYVIRSDNGGLDWTYPMDIVDDDFAEGVFASIAAVVDNNFHLIYQRDYQPGHHLTKTQCGGGACDPENDGKTINDIVYISCPKDALLTWGISKEVASIGTIETYPNPATSFTNISLNNNYPGKMNMAVYNAMGQQLTAIDYNLTFTGNHQFTLNTSTYQPGIYFVNITLGNNTVTRKLIIE